MTTDRSFPAAEKEPIHPLLINLDPFSLSTVWGVGDQGKQVKSCLLGLAFRSPSHPGPRPGNRNLIKCRSPSCHSQSHQTPIMPPPGALPGQAVPPPQAHLSPLEYSRHSTSASWPHLDQLIHEVQLRILGDIHCLLHFLSTAPGLSPVCSPCLAREGQSSQVGTQRTALALAN